MSIARSNPVALAAAVALVIAVAAAWVVFSRWAGRAELPQESVPHRAVRPPSSVEEGEAPAAAAAGERSLVEVAVVPKPTVEVLVLDGDRLPVVGARVALGLADPDNWRLTVEACTGGDGMAVFPRPDRLLDLAVFAHGKGTSFEVAGVGPQSERRTVVLSHGRALRGRVASVSGDAVPGVLLRLIGRVGRPLAMPGFVLDSELPQADMSLAPPNAAFYVQEARTGADGSFHFEGLAPDWRVAITLVDDRWILSPAAVHVEDVSQFLGLVVHRASGVDLKWLDPSGPPGAEYVISAAGEGWSKSFAVIRRGSGARLRYAPPADAGGVVHYTVRAIGPSQVAGAASAPVGDIASLEVVPRNPRVRSIRILPQWSDGTLCDSGIFVWAHDAEGKPVPARLVRPITMGYEVEVDASATSVRVLAKDSWREESDAPEISLAGVVADIPVGVTMPTGGELLILVPDGPPTAVILAGPLGIRVLSVRGSQRLRAVVPGIVSAKTSAAGVERRAEVRVLPGAVVTIDFTQ